MEDRQIVDLYFERSESAISETDKKYGRYCHYIAYRILENDEDAKEIVNDTYLKAWNTIPPNRPDPLKPYVGMLSRQLSLDRYEEYHTQKRGGQVMLVLDELFVLLLMTWGICETAGSNHYNYKGYVVDVIEENGDTVIVTLSGNAESRFTLKWYSREKYKKETKDIEIGDLVMLSTTQYSNANIKKISIDYGYSTEGKLVYINELPDTPFILAVEPTTQMKYLISIVPTDTDLFDGVKMGETIRIYHTYPITAQTITILSDAQAYSMGNGGAGLTVEDKAFIEAKGYTVKE